MSHLNKVFAAAALIAAYVGFLGGGGIPAGVGQLAFFASLIAVLVSTVLASTSRNARARPVLVRRKDLRGAGAVKPR